MVSDETPRKFSRTVYSYLRRRARILLSREKGRLFRRIDATELVHDVWLKLERSGTVGTEQKSDFQAIAAAQLPKVLLDLVRRHHAQKRSGGYRKITLTGTVLASKDGVDVNLLTDALEELKGMEPAYAHVAELKIASNLTGDEIAEHLGIGARTVDKYWALGRAWISRKLQEGAHS